MVGICVECGCQIRGDRRDIGVTKYCCRQHRLDHETEEILGPTGPFRSLIGQYMATAAANYYKPGTLNGVRASLANFFRFVVSEEKIQSLDDIRASSITRFIAAERERGLTSRNYVGHISTLFNWLISEERYDRVNPVVPRIHNQRQAPAEARPYSDVDMHSLWNCVEASGKLELMSAFAIGEECGLRAGEVCNIRLSDIDWTAQTIFVRLPTKNNRIRTVPFHSKVKRYLTEWLAQRDPRCPSDHLLHNQARQPFNTMSLGCWFKRLFSKDLPPMNSFTFHRLRHTWATRLMNNGMELAVLKVLGGWEKWNSMQRYIRVLDSTIRSQYEASYAKLQEKMESGEEEIISLVDFALMDEAKPATPSASST
jgi:integrase